MLSPILEIKNLSFLYQLGPHQIKALTDINLTIRSGEFVCLKGPSGSGKSTLLNLLGLIERVQVGELFFQNKNIRVLKERQLNLLRRYEFGFIFQNFHLNSAYSTELNVEYFLIKQGLSKKERQRRVDESLDKVGLLAFKAHRPLELSGGQMQRVAIARALAKKPKVIIADEPTASLDQKNAQSIISILKNESLQNKITVIMASHDPIIINEAGRVITLLDGEIKGDEK